jgi:hypothetical protein
MQLDTESKEGRDQQERWDTGLLKRSMELQGSEAIAATRNGDCNPDGYLNPSALSITAGSSPLQTPSQLAQAKTKPRGVLNK